MSWQKHLEEAVARPTVKVAAAGGLQGVQWLREAAPLVAFGVGLLSIFWLAIVFPLVLHIFWRDVGLAGKTIIGVFSAFVTICGVAIGAFSVYTGVVSFRASGRGPDIPE